MKGAGLSLPVDPIDQLTHQAGGVEWGRGVEHHRNLSPGIIEGRDTVQGCLVVPAMPRVLLAVDEQVTMELANMVLRDRDRAPGVEHDPHHLRVSGDFLFIPRGKRGDLEIGEQSFDIAVGKPAALDPCRRADALDRGDMPQ